MLKRSGYNEDAQCVLLKSIKAEPCLWSAWYELASLLKDKSDVCTHNWIYNLCVYITVLCSLRDFLQTGRFGCQKVIFKSSGMESIIMTYIRQKLGNKTVLSCQSNDRDISTISKLY